MAILGKLCSSLFLSLYQLTALHLAAVAGHVDTVRCLADKGADVNTKECNGVSEGHYTTDCESLMQVCVILVPSYLTGGFMSVIDECIFFK